MHYKKKISKHTPKTILEIYRFFDIVVSRFKLVYRYNARSHFGSKINIAFVVQRTEVWNSVQTLYQAAVNNPDINVYIIALPPTPQHTSETQESVDNFFRSFKESTVVPFIDNETGQSFDISSISPDYLILTTPYDLFHPHELKIERMAKHAKLCYIPYGYTLLESGLQKITLSLNLLRHVSMIFAENRITYKYCKKYLWLSESLFGKCIYQLGYPRFDLYKKFQQDHGQYKLNLLWIPRWSGNSNNSSFCESSSFFEIKDKIIDYLQKERDIYCSIRPHPLAFFYYVKSAKMTVEEVNEYKDKITRLENAYLDTKPDYLDSLRKADVLIADFSSLLAEFFILERPIIYLGSRKNFATENIGMYNSFYHAQHWADVESLLVMLKSGIDPQKEERRRIVADFLQKQQANAGERILDAILADYAKWNRKYKAKVNNPSEK